MDHYKHEEAGLRSPNQLKSMISEYVEPCPPRPRTSSTARKVIFVAVALMVLGFLAKEINRLLPTNGPPKPYIQPIHTVPRNKRAADANLCTSELCQSYATQIRANLAKNYTVIDPCVDMDMYACEGWRDTHDYRPEQNEIGTYTTMEDNNQNLMRHILESPYDGTTSLAGDLKPIDKSNFNKMQIAYSSCMNEDAAKASGMAFLQKILADFEKQYPVAAPNGGLKVDSKEELTNVLIWLAQHMFSELVSVTILTNPTNRAEVGIYLSGEDDADLSKEDFKKSATINNYTKMMAAMMEVVKSGKSGSLAKPDAKALAAAKKITDFQGKISKIVPDQEALNDLTGPFKVMSPTELDNLVPTISISTFLQKQAPTGYTVTKVNVYTASYFKSLASILKAADRKTLHDYFEWGLIRALLDGLHKDFTSPLLKFKKSKGAKEAAEVSVERWRTCLVEIDTELGWIESAFFVQRAFGKGGKELGERIIGDIKQVYLEKLKSPGWMSDDAKSASINKVKKMNLKIGYSTASPNVLDPKSINEWYRGIKVSDSRFSNIIEFNRFKYNMSWNDLLRPADLKRWPATMVSTDGGYDPLYNEITYPAGYMQLPGFAAGLPEYVSYGGLGSTASYDLLHSFDGNGSRYDASGRPTAGWDNTTLAAYEKKTTCFVEQYNKFSTPGLATNNLLKVNGTLTRDENVADAAGLTTAYAAWQKRDQANPGPGLPGLEKYTNEQLFFLSYATSSCGKRRVADQVKAMTTEPHSPGKFRINGALANSGAFRKAFNCPVKTPTCELW